ncbi:response regulator transcription factor [Prochlorothrix hollandica]|uniref:histidine kinase n=1 Tax=Prochlorothrix hollandica PCC 9006 = CALU 1027 TaxID=317619 RepID=A0A0M2Q106_PROHO|nr:response regulator [Prochlorothrix hollandica]KKJ00644.1 response regulator receiver protein [Prochlorothrix hollandica PCC 9006 = CALU 1027]
MTTILVIEDDPLVRNNLEDILSLENFKFISASNGLEGVASAKTHKPDLIICDIMMPELDGYGVLRSLQQDSRTQHIPFIFLTAKADHSDCREGMELGADDYLTKPFRPKDIVNAIKSRLARYALSQIQYRQQQEDQQSLERQVSEQSKLSEIKENLLSQLTQDLREPLSNINLALHMLSHAKTDTERDRYIEVLKQEYNREMRLLDNASNLQDMITPQNIKLLRQFNLLKET